MLKLTKTSVGTALAAAILLGTSSANASLTFQLLVGGNATYSSTGAGDVIPVTLVAVISGTNNGGYDLGGSFVATTGVGGASAGFSGAALNSQFSFVGSQVGTVFNPGTNTIWGGGTIASDQYNSTGFFYARAGASGGTGGVSPVLGSTLTLGTINYKVSAADVSGGSLALKFIPRDRPGVVDQIWQEGGVVVDDTTGTVLTNALAVSFGPSISTWTSTVAGDWGTAGNWSSPPANSPTTAVVFGAAGASGSVSLVATHEVNSITFNGNTAYTIAGPAAVTIDGASPIITATGTQVITAPLVLGANGLTKAGSGSVSVNNLRTTGTVSITGGTLKINAAGGTAGASKVAGLSITGTGSLDLYNNAIVISGTSASAVALKIAAGTIKTTNVAVLNTGIGFADASDANIANLSGSLEGQSFTTGDTLARYTYLGDANLDGKTDFSDLGYLLANYGKPGTKTWTQGDFNGDGSVNFSDLGFLLATYNKPTLLSSGDISLSTSFAAVPEPASLALLGLGASALLRKKKR